MDTMEEVEIEIGFIAEAVTHGDPSPLELEWLDCFETHFAERYQIEREKEFYL